MKLLVVIPSLNEERTLGSLIENIPKKIENVDVVDALVIDDGSEDNTSLVATSAGAMVVRHTQNLGVGRALQTGINYSLKHGYDLMVNIDADLQFDPKEIELLVDPVVKGAADVAIGSRFLSKSPIKNLPATKKWGNSIVSFIVSKIIGQKFYDVSSGFRCYSRSALQCISIHSNFTYTQESFVNLAYWGFALIEIPVSVVYHEDRDSRVVKSIGKYGWNILCILLGLYRDYYPLKFFSLISIILIIPSAIFGFIFIAHYLATGLFAGYLFAGIISGFLFSLSTLTFFIGVLAQMLVRLRVNQERILNRMNSDK